MKLKGRKWWLVIAASFLTGISCLYGCGAVKPGDDHMMESETGASVQRGDFFEPIPTDVSGNDGSSDADTGGWKEYYSRLISAALVEQKEKAENVSDDVPTQYYFYDIDEDDVPELIVERGRSEAGRYGQIYTWKNRKGSQLFESNGTSDQNLSLSHAILYSDPNENGVIVWQAHMGYARMERLSLNNSGDFSRELLKEEKLADDQTVEDYTSPSAVVMGAQELPSYGLDVMPW